MPYSPIQDGTQKHGVAVGPVTIDGVEYIAEEFSYTTGSDIVGINGQNGLPSGQVIYRGNPTGSTRLQIADISVPPPPFGALFTFGGMDWYVSEVGEQQALRAYAYYNISFTGKIAV